MTKKLRVRVIGTLLVSALLFVLPIGAILSNNSMVTTVHAEDSDAEVPDNGTEIIVERLDEGGSGENTDDNYSKYGGTALEYRLIDLENPFPGREAGANWKAASSSSIRWPRP